MRILLVDDHPLFVDGLKGLLLDRGVQVVGTARDGLEALEQARALRPQVILMDLRMPRLDGLAATRLIKAEMPEIQIVILSVSDDGDVLLEAIKSGASGYLLKGGDTAQFLQLLFGLEQGLAPFSPGMATRILDEFGAQSVRGESAAPPVHGEPAAESGRDESAALEVEHKLSGRQFQVLTLLAQGLTYKQIGRALAISERTVKYHMSEIIQRLNVECRAQVLEYARLLGMGGKT